MSEPPTARGGTDDDVFPPAASTRAGRRASLSGMHMAAIFDDLRYTESSAYLLPIIRLMRMHNGMKDDSDEISKRDLQQLAIAWGLSKQQGFWSANATVTALMRALYKQARKLEESGESAQFIEAIKRQTVVEKCACGVCECGWHALTGRVHELAPPPCSLCCSIKDTRAAPVKRDWRRTLAAASTKTGLGPYNGDMFGQRGEYSGGIVYASRAPPDKVPSKRGGAARIRSYLHDARAYNLSDHAPCGCGDRLIRPPGICQRPAACPVAQRPGVRARPRCIAPAQSDSVLPALSLQAAAKRKVADAEAEAAVLDSMAALDGAADEAATAAAFEALRLSSTSTLVEIAQNPKLRAEIADPAAVQARQAPCWVWRAPR